MTYVNVDGAEFADDKIVELIEKFQAISLDTTSSNILELISFSPKVQLTRRHGNFCLIAATQGNGKTFFC